MHEASQGFQLDLCVVVLLKSSYILEKNLQSGQLFFPLIDPTLLIFCGSEPLCLKVGEKLPWVVPVGLCYASGNGPHSLAGCTLLSCFAARFTSMTSGWALISGLLLCGQKRRYLISKLIEMRHYHLVFLLHRGYHFREL